MKINKFLKIKFKLNLNKMLGSSSDVTRDPPLPVGDENELKRTLYESMKNSGVLGSLKSQLRSKLYD